MAEAARATPQKKAKKPKIQQHEVVVAEVVQETHDTVTLLLAKADPNDTDPWEYQAGQFCTLRPHELPALAQLVAYFEDIKGKREPARAYSLATAPHEPHVGITVKEEHYYAGESKFPPLLSPFLVYSTPVGTRFTIQGFGGPYTFPDDIAERTDHIVHICSGSGSVPNYGLIKYALHEGLDLRHTFVYGNKTWDDVIYRDALGTLAERHPDRLRMVHCLTRQQDESVFNLATVRKGRVSRELLEELIPDHADAEYYLCGSGITKWDRLAAKEAGIEPSPKFLEGVLMILEDMGVDKDRIHKESW